MTSPSIQESEDADVSMPSLKSLTALRQRLDRLAGRRQERQYAAAEVQVRLGELAGFRKRRLRFERFVSER